MKALLVEALWYRGRMTRVVADSLQVGRGVKSLPLMGRLAARRSGFSRRQVEHDDVDQRRRAFSHWRYESEVRCFVGLDPDDCENGLYFMPFSEQLALREVFVGHCADVSRAELAAALGDACDAVIQRKARLAFRSFRIFEQRRASFWT